GSRAVLTVEDQGPGIPPDEREAVFRAYVRGEDHLEGDTGGTGIGLAIVWDLVERAGGSTRAEGVPGGGARLRVEVPLVALGPRAPMVPVVPVVPVVATGSAAEPGEGS
ncbi:MAG TPA: ATP-binding protein, partial [Longimicrobiales bacterium]|nr:ATP-binding protein [Longimicrobiales bacterium]